MPKQTTIEMSLEVALLFCFKDEAYEGERRKWFSNKDAAETYSESLSHLWVEELGYIYGPFCNSKVVSSGNHYWWEVSYK